MVNDEAVRKSSHNSFNQSMDISKDSLIKYKTELCRTWVEMNNCPYKDKCRFAHGKKDLHEKIVSGKKYKQKECNSFYTKGFCPYGPRCHFKHDERKLDEIIRIYYQYILEIDYSRNRRLHIFESIVSSNKDSLLYSPNRIRLLHNYADSVRLF